VSIVTSARRTTFFTGILLEPDDFRLEQDSVRGRSREVELEVRDNGATERWTEVPGLDGSGPDDRHFVLDRETGRVVFGDGEHGRKPEPGSRIEASYGCGGGSRAAWIAIPFAAGVAGFLAAVLRHRRA
jgi:hypothetical protein